MKETHYRACNLCEAICGLTIELEDGKVQSIKGDKDDPFSRGHICPKGTQLKDLYEDPDRLKRPLKKVDGQWKEVEWVEALSEVARRLHEIQETHGKNAVGIYAGNPSVHNIGTMLYGQRFFHRLKSKNNYSATSVDQLPHQLMSYWMFGHQLFVPIPDIDRTDYFLILGANPLASNGSLMTVPDVRKRLNAIQARGGKYVVVDPRRNETAELADEHLFIRPGTDAFFLMAVLRFIFESGRAVDSGHFRMEALDTIRELVKTFDPEEIATVTGIPVAQMERIAMEFSAASSAVCYGRVGVSTQEFGTICQWLINVINIVTGNMDRPGGAMFTKPAVDVVDPKNVMSVSTGSYNSFQSRVRGLPEFGGELPVSALAEEILTEGDNRIRAMVTSAGNPVLSTPNGTQLAKAFESLEFMVSIDIYLNETTQHADFILPPTVALEHDHYDLVFNVFAVRNTAKYSPPACEPEEGMLHDWEIFGDLIKRLDFVKSGKTLPGEIIRPKLSPAAMIDFALQGGPYGIKAKDPGKLSLQYLKDNPHGVDLGPLQPGLPHRLCTKDKLIELLPEKIQSDLPRLQKRLKEWKTAFADQKSLLLIGRRHLRSNNSWMHNLPRLMSGKDRCTLMINPADAEQTHIRDGQICHVESRTGSVHLPAEITETMMPGVVSIPHGFGHIGKTLKLQVATEHAGASINDLTDDQAIDVLSGNAAFSGVPVQVSPG